MPPFDNHLIIFCLQTWVGLEPTPTIFFSTAGHPYLTISVCYARTPSPTYALSGMVIKKGRFGTDPYDIFHEHGTSRTFFPRPLGEGQGEG